MEEMRVHKWLSQLGVMSRREAEQYILNGKVHINGHRVTELGTKLDPQVDNVTVVGRNIPKKPAPLTYWILNKPVGLVTTHSDEQGRPNIFQLPQIKKMPFQLKSVGRLDMFTEGLLILSNDGDLVHRLMHPKFKIPRHYKVFVLGRLSEKAEFRLRRGIRLEDGPVKGVELEYLKRGHQGAWYKITVEEGRNRIIRRLFEAVGHKVLKLSRVGFGSIALPPHLAVGKCQPLNPMEIRSLKRITSTAQAKKSVRFSGKMSTRIRQPKAPSLSKKLS